MGRNGTEIARGLGVFEKALPDMDEDTITISVEAARAAMARRKVDQQISERYM